MSISLYCYRIGDNVRMWSGFFGELYVMVDVNADG